MSLTSQGLTPRMRPLSSRKSATLSILDIGTSKVVCLIAELNPAEANERLRGRTHVARIVGIGHQRSLGLKGGAIIDLDSAERAIRAAVDAAERMAKVEVQSVIVNLTGGRLNSQHYQASVELRGGSVGDSDVKRVLATTASTSRWQRSTASMTLRAAAASEATTCMSTESEPPISPRGSSTPGEPSSA